MVFLMLFCGLGGSEEEAYFPASSPYVDYPFSSHAGALQLMNEPSLWKPSIDRAVHAYRFTWLRTFHNPLAVRVNIEESGKGTLTATVLTGQGGFKYGEIQEQKPIELGSEDMVSLVSGFQKSEYWELPTLDPDADLGLDGSEWLLEAVHEGKYHAVSRWSPDEGPVRELGLMLLEMSGLPIDKIY